MQLAPTANSKAHAANSCRKKAGAHMAVVQMAGCNGQAQMAGYKSRARVRVAGCKWPGENSWVQREAGVNGQSAKAGRK